LYTDWPCELLAFPK